MNICHQSSAEIGARLLDAISTGAEAPTERTVDVLVSRVRKKTGTSGNGLIVTVTGVGYTCSASTL